MKPLAIILCYAIGLWIAAVGGLIFWITLAVVLGCLWALAIEQEPRRCPAITVSRLTLPTVVAACAGLAILLVHLVPAVPTIITAIALVILFVFAADKIIKKPA